MLQPGTNPTPLAVNTLDGGTLASMAVSERSFFIRTASHLYRLAQKAE